MPTTTSNDGGNQQDENETNKPAAFKVWHDATRTRPTTKREVLKAKWKQKVQRSRVLN